LKGLYKRTHITAAGVHAVPHDYVVISSRGIFGHFPNSFQLYRWNVWGYGLKLSEINAFVF